VIYNDEFSSRLSVAAIMRLRVAALQALAADANTDSALLTKLTNQLFREGHRNESEETVHTIQQEIEGQSQTNSSKGEGSAGEQNENPAREHVQWQRRKR
jgi:ribosomal protein S7